MTEIYQKATNAAPHKGLTRPDRASAGAALASEIRQL